MQDEEESHCSAAEASFLAMRRFVVVGVYS
jgi:hypothetical protein